MDACENCREEGEELHWLGDGWNIWACADCYAACSMMAEAEARCPELYGQVFRAAATPEMSRLMAEHSCAGCSR